MIHVLVQGCSIISARSGSRCVSLHIPNLLSFGKIKDDHEFYLICISVISDRYLRWGHGFSSIVNLTP